MRKNVLELVFFSTLALLFTVISQIATFAVAAPATVRLEFYDNYLVAWESSVEFLKFLPSQFNAFQRQIIGEEKLVAELLEKRYLPEVIQAHSPLLHKALEEDRGAVSSFRHQINRLKQNNNDFFVNLGQGKRVRDISVPLYMSFKAWAHGMGQGKVDPAELLFWSLNPKWVKKGIYNYLKKRPSPLPTYRVLAVLQQAMAKQRVTGFPGNDVAGLYALVMFHRNEETNDGLSLLYNDAIAKSIKIDMPILLKGLDN